MNAATHRRQYQDPPAWAPGCRELWLRVLELHDVVCRHVIQGGFRTLPVVTIGAIVSAVTVLTVPIAFVLDIPVPFTVGLRVSC